MSHLPKIAIVGRPNVGKSHLFNRICKQRLSIVDEMEGVTRDRLYAKAEVFGHPFELIDTGGIHTKSKEKFNEEIKRQAEIAIEEADSLIMVVDSQVGVTDLDIEVAHILLKTKKPVCLAINKIDDPSKEYLEHHFFQLGIQKMIPVSAEHGLNIAELLESALEEVECPKVIEEEEEGIKVAIVGRTNVGKSSLLNAILNDERSVVSTIPGTTRDAIDAKFSYEDQEFTLIDTAGIRRKKSETEVVDKFAAIRTVEAIERSDVCLLILDSLEGLTTQEKRIAKSIEEAGKGCLLLFNKWDLMKGVRMEHLIKTLERDVPFLKHCPKIFISAKTHRNIDKIFPEIKKVYASAEFRISTHQLNKFITLAIQKNHPPMIQGRRLRIYYMAQVGTRPPTFVMFVNHPNLMHDTFKKYLINQFREQYQFTGVPLRFYLRGKGEASRRRDRALPKEEEIIPDEEPEYFLEEELD